MDPTPDNVLTALARFRDALAHGVHNVRSARRVLAGLRLDLLRLRQRPIALRLSDGSWSADRMVGAVDAAIAMLQAEVVERRGAA